MRVFEVSKSFGLDNFGLCERPDPSLPLAPNDIVLKMRAASPNFRDVLMIRGQYNPRQPLPLIGLSDGVGEVIATGSRVARVRVGDRVIPTFFQSWVAGEPSKARLSSALGGPLDGTLAEYMLLHEDGVVHAPAHLTDEESATLPCAALTAWNALANPPIAAGDVVLVQGTGGVSLFALQFARLHGAQVIVTSRSDAKLERARSLGAAHGINYETTRDWGRAARDWTGGCGVDRVIEVGGAGTLAQSVRAVRPGGTIALIGVLSGASTEINVASILMQNIRVQGVIVGHRDLFESMNRAIVAHAVRPIVDRVFPFEEAREALTYLASGQHFGKLCVRIS